MRILVVALTMAFLLVVGSASARAYTAEASDYKLKTQQSDSAKSTAGRTHIPSQSVEEIIVTAQKREESLQKVPISITAISPKDIQVRGYTEYKDFIGAVPGITADGGKRNANHLAIRGVTTSIGPLGQSAVASYIDDIPIGHTRGAPLTPQLRLYDVERVEVLRGPQGTLFGSGSLSGAVRVLTQKPVLNSYDFDVGLDIANIEHGDWSSRVNGMVNVPLIEDRLAVRAVGYYRDEAGYIDNVGVGIENSNSAEESGGRLSLRWRPSEHGMITLSATQQDSEPQDESWVNLEIGELQRSTPLTDASALKINVYNAAIDYEFTEFTFTSVSTYADTPGVFRQDLSEAAGGGLFPYIFAHDPNVGRYFSQELRLASAPGTRVEWIVGGFLRDEHQLNRNKHRTDPNFWEALGVTGLEDGVLLINNVTLDNKETAIFGDVTFHVSDTVSLNGGLRYSEYDTKIAHDIDDPILSKVPGAFAFFRGGPSHIEFVESHDPTRMGADSAWTGKASLSWEPTDNHTYYLLASKGYRIGWTNPTGYQNDGVSLVDPNDLIIQKQYEPDYLWNYEIGAKTRWFDRRMVLNVSAFYMPWFNIQLQGNRPSDGKSFVANASKAVSKGVEVEASLRPTDRWDVRLGFSVQDAKITKASAQETLITGLRRGDKLPTAVDFQVAASAQYSWPLANVWEMFARIDAFYVDSSPNGFPGQSLGRTNTTFVVDSGYENINASMGISLYDRWKVTIYGENLSNHDDPIRTLPTSTSLVVVQQPRTLGLRVGYEF